MAVYENTTAPEAGARTTRRALIAGALSATACVPAGALANPYPTPRADMEGMAIMHLNGRRLLVDLHCVPEPGDEVVALMPAGYFETPELACYRAIDNAGTSTGFGPHGDRTAWRDITPPGESNRHMTPGQAIGVVIGGI